MGVGKFGAKIPRYQASALRGNRTPGGSMATTQVTTTPLMLQLYHHSQML